MSYKRLTPCIFIEHGKAIRWFDNKDIVSEDVVALAKHYCAMGADELIIFDLSDSDEEHTVAINLMRKINHSISIPVIAGGNIKSQEDVKKILYAGAKRAILNFSKPASFDLIKAVCDKFGRERIAVSLNDFDTLFKQQHLIEEYSYEILFMHRLDLNSVVNVTEIPCIVLTDTMDQNEILKILKSDGVKGVSGLYISQENMDFNAFKTICDENGIQMTSFESQMEFSEFKLNEEGLLPVIAQDYKTNEVLMLGYMNQEAFEHTVKTGRMTYYSRSQKKQRLKGVASGHYQYVKSLTIDCDKDTLLAKVEQIGSACHTGNHSCFYQPIVGEDLDCKDSLQILKSVYKTILDQKKNPVKGSYTTSLFDKGLDKILKKIGKTATEVIIAAKNPDPDEIKCELSDFLYHTIVLMVEKGITWEDIVDEFENR